MHSENKVDVVTIICAVAVFLLIIGLIYFFREPISDKVSGTTKVVKPSSTATSTKTTTSTKSTTATPDSSDDSLADEAATSSTSTSSSQQDIEEVSDCDENSVFMYRSCDLLATREIEVTLFNNGRGTIEGAYVYIIGDNKEFRTETHLKSLSAGGTAILTINIPSYENKIGTIARIKAAPISKEGASYKACINQIQTFDPDVDCK